MNTLDIRKDITIAVKANGHRLLAWGPFAVKRMEERHPDIVDRVDGLAYSQLCLREAYWDGMQWRIRKIEEDPLNHFTYHTSLIFPGCLTNIGACPKDAENYYALGFEPSAESTELSE